MTAQTTGLEVAKSTMIEVRVDIHTLTLTRVPVYLTAGRRWNIWPESQESQPTFLIIEYIFKVHKVRAEKHMINTFSLDGKLVCEEHLCGYVGVRKNMAPAIQNYPQQSLITAFSNLKTVHYVNPINKHGWMCIDSNRNMNSVKMMEQQLCICVLDVRI